MPFLHENYGNNLFAFNVTKYINNASNESVHIFGIWQLAVHYLESQGAEVVAIQIPELEEARVAHILTILSEMRLGLQEAYWNHFSEQVLYPDIKVN